MTILHVLWDKKLKKILGSKKQQKLKYLENKDLYQKFKNKCTSEIIFRICLIAILTVLFYRSLRKTNTENI